MNCEFEGNTHTRHLLREPIAMHAREISTAISFVFPSAGVHAGHTQTMANVTCVYDTYFDG